MEKCNLCLGSGGILGQICPACSGKGVICLHESYNIMDRCRDCGKISPELEENTKRFFPKK